MNEYSVRQGNVPFEGLKVREAAREVKWSRWKSGGTYMLKNYPM